jgi:hypothetical protein
MPLSTIACQARGFDAEDRSDGARTYGAQQLLESASLDQSRSRASQILVDHRDPLETQLARVFLQSILPPPALLMMQHLARRRLANVDHRSAVQSFSGQLGVHGFLLPLRLVRRRR